MFPAKTPRIFTALILMLALIECVAHAEETNTPSPTAAVVTAGESAPTANSPTGATEAPTSAPSETASGSDSGDYEIDYEEEPEEGVVAEDSGDEAPVAKSKKSKSASKGKGKGMTGDRITAISGTRSVNKFAPMMKSDTKSVYKKDGKALDVDTD